MATTKPEYVSVDLLGPQTAEAFKALLKDGKAFGSAVAKGKSKIAYDIARILEAGNIEGKLPTQSEIVKASHYTKGYVSRVNTAMVNMVENTRKGKWEGAADFFANFEGGIVAFFDTYAPISRKKGARKAGAAAQAAAEGKPSTMLSIVEIKPENLTGADLKMELHNVHKHIGAAWDRLGATEKAELADAVAALFDFVSEGVEPEEKPEGAKPKPATTAASA